VELDSGKFIIGNHLSYLGEKKKMKRILIVKQDDLFAEQFVSQLKKYGYDFSISITNYFSYEFTQHIMQSFDLIIIMINKKVFCVFEAIKKIRKYNKLNEILVISDSQENVNIKKIFDIGVWDFLIHPVSMTKIIKVINDIGSYRKEGVQFSEKIIDKKIIGESQAIQKCLKDIRKIATTETNVLITGDTGTGKELAASSIHEKSHRSKNNFVILDCTVLPENLAESILFGHEKGSFTDAKSFKEGIFSRAHNGTLFIDEIGDLSLSIQKKFLRILQEKEYRTIGGKKKHKSNFRLITATNRNIEEMVKQGTFRKDLYYRLIGCHIKLPSLSERLEDIPLLLNYYLNNLVKKYDISPKNVSQGFIDALCSYNWPGNIREFVNTIDYVISVNKSTRTLIPKYIPNNIRVKTIKKESSQGGLVDSNSKDDKLLPFSDARERSERNYLKQLLSVTNGNIKQMCEISCLSRSYLYKIIKKHNLLLKN